MSMDQERASSILFLAFFILLLPFPLHSLHTNDDFAKNYVKNVTLLFNSSIMNNSLPLSTEKQLLDAQVLSMEFKPLMISKDYLEDNNGGLVISAVFYQERNRSLTVFLLHTRKWIKKPSPPFRFSTFQPKYNGKKDIVLGIYTPVLALISIVSAIFTLLKKMFTTKKLNPQIPSPEIPTSDQESTISNLLVTFHKFTYSELSAATNDFHQSQLLGTGRYASVYKAIFPGLNTIFAVKRFNQNVSSNTSFLIEAMAIHRLQHDKILELRGWCNDNPHEPLLVYDYMPHKSLEEALCNRQQPLLWPSRYKIAIGVAEALVYLHECLPMVIHGDIREANVMLDEDFNPKLGDFGLAMSVPPYTLWRERTEQDPPECQMDAVVTEKIDVYLYGFMVIGLCCQRIGHLNVFYEVLRNLKLDGKLLLAVDKRLDGKYDEEEMLRLLNVGLLCLEEEIQERPSMMQVFQILTSEGDADELDPIS